MLKLNLLRVRYFCFQLIVISLTKIWSEKDILVSIILEKRSFNFPDTKGKFQLFLNLPLKEIDLQNQKGKGTIESMN